MNSLLKRRAISLLIALAISFTLSTSALWAQSDSDQHWDRLHRVEKTSPGWQFAGVLTKGWIEGDSLSLMEKVVSAIGATFVWGFVAFLINVWSGNRQRIEGGGTWQELLRVALLMALIQSIPFVAGMSLLIVSNDSDQAYRILDSTVIFSILSLLWTSLYLLPPTRWTGSKEAMPVIADEEFQTRLSEMSAAMHIATPVARLIPSSGATLAFQAFAGGLPKPSLTLSDGILLRLDRPERDAVVAHELGHVASGSLWLYPITVCVSWAIGILSSPLWGFLSPVLFTMAVYIGLGRIVSRYYEFDSDRRAAETAGALETISALDKIHHGSMLRNSGWASFLAYSMSTHPSHEERLQAICDETQLQGHPEVKWSTATARKRRLGSWIALLLWVVSLTVVLLTPASGIWGVVRTLILLAVLLAPIITLNLAIRKEVKADLMRQQAQTRNRTSWTSFITIMLTSMALSYWIFDSETGELDLPVTIISFGALFLFFAFLGRWKSSRSEEAKIRLLLHQRRWDEAVTLGQKYAKSFRNDPKIQHDLILALWMTGRHAAAIRSMEALRGRFPDFHHAWLTEATMHLDQGDLNAALQRIQEVRSQLPNDISPAGVAARCYRLQGDVEAVEREARIIEQLMPDSASVAALDCAITMDKGDPESARKHWDEADRRAPGDPFVTLLKAELEFQYGDPKAGEQALSEAQVRINATPYCFLGAELKRVLELSEQNSQIESGTAAQPANIPSPPLPESAFDDPEE